ncbi:hypothetical protein [Arthrobacter sp. H35-D1]|uniref:hypothetical protein n=1 Tax=Arthrobacter sp. H35-D1 TaxID=3046202 RepID=UPI0024BAF615|nr:hypothetical protein [Arthrobacter sp. H35-D1]MDJ0311987.1 hypothetical protein [Arthrobacter sp. H35-D1]
MSNPWWPAVGSGGPAELGGVAGQAGPSAEAVAVVAQRLVGIARDIDALRLQLGGVGAMDWSSPAAFAFREALSACNAALALAVRKVESAGASVGSYGVYLQSESAESACRNPNLPQGAGSGAEFGPRFGQGFGPDWGSGF